MAANPITHKYKGITGAAYFYRARRSKLFHILALAKPISRICKTQNRAHLIVQECNGYSEQQEGRADDPYEQIYQPGVTNTVVGHQHPQHAALKGDLDQIIFLRWLVYNAEG